MEDESLGGIDHCFNSALSVLNQSYQFDLRRVVSPETCELIHALCDFYMYDSIGLFIHLLGITSHYLTPTSSIYVDNQLKHKLNLHLLLVVRSGYERFTLVEHVRESMVNIHCLRQTEQNLDTRNSSTMNIFCRPEENNVASMSICLSDRFDQHATSAHLQQHHSSSIIGMSNGDYLRKLLDIKYQHQSQIPGNFDHDWLIVFLASKAHLFCRRSKFFDSSRYPSLEQWIIVINCHCTNTLDFYFDDPHANQVICDYLDTLSLKSISLEETHPWMSARYQSAREHVVRVAASIAIIEFAIETLIVYRRTFHTFGQNDKTFFENCLQLIEQTRATTAKLRMTITASVVQSAIYFVNASLKQYEIVFEPALTSANNNLEHPSMSDRFWPIHSSIPLPSRSTTSPSSINNVTSAGPPLKRLKTYIDPSYVKSLELAYELLLLPYVAFTRTSLYANSKLKRNAAYLDSVIEELKKHRLLILVRQGVQMVDGTRRRVDLLVKCVPLFVENEPNKIDDDLSERLNRFDVDYERYIHTLSKLDIGDKYRLSDQCFELLNSPAYKRFLKNNLERIAPIHRLQHVQNFQSHSHHRRSSHNEDNRELWTSSSSSSVNLKHEPEEFYG